MNTENLIEAARAARTHAYCPYSGYAVGAAVLGTNGRIYSGCNVENASYGLTICAERNAVASMVSDGCTSASALALVTANGAPPCGACLQVLSEFADDSIGFEIVCATEAGQSAVHTLSELFPSRFRL